MTLKFEYLLGQTISGEWHILDAAGELVLARFPTQEAAIAALDKIMGTDKWDHEVLMDETSGEGLAMMEKRHSKVN